MAPSANATTSKVMTSYRLQTTHKHTMAITETIKHAVGLEAGPSTSTSPFRYARSTAYPRLPSRINVFSSTNLYIFVPLN